MKSLNVVCLGLFAVLLLAGCPTTGIVCQPGTTRCAQGCIDSTADSRNCGTCANACRSGQVCNDSVCKCSAGTSPCGSECAVLATDPKNCGDCGHACGATQVCEFDATADAGTCKTSCPGGGPTPTVCAGGCVNLNSNAANCGGCGVACENSQSCHGGHCAYDLVAACFSSGQVVGLQQSSEFKGPVEPLGTGPAALASDGEVLLAVDGIDQRLYQARHQSVGGHAFAQLPRANVTGSVPNQVWVDAPYVYVVNSGSGTVQVLKDFGTAAFPDGGSTSADGGLALATVAELPLGANTYPEGLVKVGTALWVPLYGGFGASGAAAGQKVVRVDVSSPEAPVVTGTVDLSAVNLKPFDGGTPVARPYAITSHQGAVYVALNNLNPDTYVPEGPGLLAKINVTDGGVSIVDLGADKCLNPLWLASDGTHLVVSCGGAAVYNGPPNYELVSTDKAAMVLLDSSDVRQSTWTPSCPVLADGGTCAPILLGRFALAGGRVYVGDQNGGRLFVLDINGNSLGERRGYYGDAGAAINACAVDTITHIANVSDVLAVP